MNKKAFLLIVSLLPSLCFADVCPTSWSQAKAGKWALVFPDKVPNFKHFKAVAWKDGGMYCAYQDAKRPSKVAVLGKKGFAKPAYGKSHLWQKNQKEDPRAIVCTASIAKCGLSRK